MENKFQFFQPSPDLTRLDALIEDLSCWVGLLTLIMEKQTVSFKYILRTLQKFIQLLPFSNEARLHIEEDSRNVMATMLNRIKTAFIEDQRYEQFDFELSDEFVAVCYLIENKRCFMPIVGRNPNLAENINRDVENMFVFLEAYLAKLNPPEEMDSRPAA
jgi:hypothetical protein